MLSLFAWALSPAARCSGVTPNILFPDFRANASRQILSDAARAPAPPVNPASTARVYFDTELAPNSPLRRTLQRTERGWVPVAAPAARAPVPSTPPPENESAVPNDATASHGSVRSDPNGGSIFDTNLRMFLEALAMANATSSHGSIQ